MYEPAADAAPETLTLEMTTPLETSQTDLAFGRRRDVRFLLTMARALQTAGTTAQRLEDSLAVMVTAAAALAPAPQAGAKRLRALECRCAIADARECRLSPGKRT